MLIFMQNADKSIDNLHKNGGYFLTNHDKPIEYQLNQCD